MIPDEASFMDLAEFITNGIVSFKHFDKKRDDFNFEIKYLPFFDGDLPRSSSYGVYISQLIRLGGYVLVIVTSTIDNSF